MRLLGLTGDIACGKSTVAQMLAVRGAAVIDADNLVHELYADPDFAGRVASLFPTNVLDESGGVDRKALGALVFADADAMSRLEALVHPAVATLRERKLALVPPGTGVTVLEAVKLLESGQARGCDVVWCVTCAPDVQLRRLMERRNLTEAQARQRMASQPSRAEKLRLCGNVPLVWLSNNGSLEELDAEVARQWNDVAGTRSAAETPRKA